MKRYRYLYLILLLGFVLRIYFTPYGTFGWDMKAWKEWGQGVYETGFSRFYDVYGTDYLPGYIYVLWLLQKVHISFPNIPVKTLFKLPANLADLGIALVIFYSLLKITDYRKALLSSLAYFFNPAPISNSTLWGQVDSVNVLPLLIAVSIGLRGYFTGAVVLAITGFMMKPLSIVIFPVIGFLICRDIYRRRKESNIALKTLLLGVKIIAASIITIDIFTLPYIWDELGRFLSFDILTQPIYFTYVRFIDAYDTYLFTSANAFNFWSLIHGLWVSDQLRFLNLTFQRWGTIIFAAIYALILFALVRYELIKKHNDIKEFSYFMFQAVTLVFFALFLFVTRAHERHLLPAIIFFTMLVFHSRLNWFLYGTVSLCYVLNMYYAHVREYPIKYFPFKYFTTSTIDPFIRPVVIILIAVFIIVLTDFMLNTVTNRRNKCRATTN
jgi:hypothetical protein